MESRKRVFARIDRNYFIATKENSPGNILPPDLNDMEIQLNDIYGILELEVMDTKKAEKGLITVLYAGNEVIIPCEFLTLVVRYERV